VRRLNRDSVVAAVLLIAGGTLFWDTFQWRRTPYATMASSVWPRFVLIIFFALCAVYLIRSLVRGVEAGSTKVTFHGWLAYYRNPLWCYGLFCFFLLTLPYLGMLIGGTLFVWAVQTVVGERTVRAQLRHATIAIASVGFMWLVFTYALDVILPAGTLFNI
jgi:putative tricarboxylic transport membrane protein